jgi:hypothetical protein
MARSETHTIYFGTSVTFIIICHSFRNTCQPNLVKVTFEQEGHGDECNGMPDSEKQTAFDQLLLGDTVLEAICTICIDVYADRVRSSNDVLYGEG